MWKGSMKIGLSWPLALAVACVLGLAAAPVALATPFVSLQDGADFQAAIDAGNVVPQTVAGDDLLYHYPDDTFSVPELYVYEGEHEGYSYDGLVMAWGDDADENYYAQWKYVYDEDPDLTGQTISAVVQAPQGISSVSLAIWDATGLCFRTWDWDVAPFGNGTIQPWAWTAITVNVVGAGAGGPGDAVPFADSYFDNGVDPTQITQFGWDENGNWVNFTTVTPGTNQQKPWNYWYNVTVTPEPSAFALLALGGLALLRRR